MLMIFVVMLCKLSSGTYPDPVCSGITSIHISWPDSSTSRTLHRRNITAMIINIGIALIRSTNEWLKWSKLFSMAHCLRDSVTSCVHLVSRVSMFTSSLTTSIWCGSQSLSTPVWNKRSMFLFLSRMFNLVARVSPLSLLGAERPWERGWRVLCYKSSSSWLRVFLPNT